MAVTRTDAFRQAHYNKYGLPPCFERKDQTDPYAIYCDDCCDYIEGKKVE